VEAVTLKDVPQWAVNPLASVDAMVEGASRMLVPERVRRAQQAAARTAPPQQQQAAVVKTNPLAGKTDEQLDRIERVLQDERERRHALEWARLSQQEQGRLAVENTLAIDGLPDEVIGDYVDDDPFAEDPDIEYVWSAAGPPDEEQSS